MRNGIFIAMVMVGMAGCATDKTIESTTDERKPAPPSQPTSPTTENYRLPDYAIYGSHGAIIARAEEKATPAAKKVLRMAHSMADQRVIIQGACWDYINEVFKRAGYPYHNLTIIHKSKKTGPYADTSKLRPGDWVYYVNHSYDDIEHSGLFIDWIDYKKRDALILSYAGEGRKSPARYQSYDLSHVYRIMRPQ